LIRILLPLLVIIILFWLLHRFMRLSPALSARYARNAGIAAIAAVLLFLALGGRLNWFFALLGVAFAALARLLPVLLRYAPELHKLWFLFRHSEEADKTRQQGAPDSAFMTVAEAYEILGLKPGASREEVIAAHKRLMQKLHPDRGGSDYLAARINQAKTILLKR
jgi:hypothetical protein